MGGLFGYIVVYLVIIIFFLTVTVGIPAIIGSLIYNRRDRELRNEAEAHRKILESTYDRIWREIKKHCGIAESYRRSFNNIYPNLIDTDIDDDTMLNWILDCNIDFDPEEYPVVMENIEEDRARFVAHQRRMMSILREHKALHARKIPHMLIKNKTYIRYVPIETNYDRWGESL